MVSTIVNRVSGLFIVVTMILTFSIITIAQEGTQKAGDDQFKQTANELTKNLAQNVNLSADQITQVSKALINYQVEIAELDPNISESERAGKVAEIDKNAITTIESTLDDNQLAIYNDIKNQWWAEVKNKVYSSTTIKTDKMDKAY